MRDRVCVRLDFTHFWNVLGGRLLGLSWKYDMDWTDCLLGDVRPYFRRFHQLVQSWRNHTTQSSWFTGGEAREKKL